jgi:hypothetical protein
MCNDEETHVTNRNNSNTNKNNRLSRLDHYVKEMD